MNIMNVYINEMQDKVYDLGFYKVIRVWIIHNKQISGQNTCKCVENNIEFPFSAKT